MIIKNDQKAQALDLIIEHISNSVATLNSSLQAYQALFE